jgi:predicted N-acyltransferase
MAPLLAALQARYGALDSVPIIRRRLAEQAAILDEKAVCFFCWKRSAMVAFSLFYEWEDELYARVVGFDYEALPEDSRAYFSILFYEPIKFAIANKIGAIHYGRGTTEAKVRRGATLEPRWSVFIDHRKDAGDA